jgi:hybrid cluster-associated redox disulfide protein
MSLAVPSRKPFQLISLQVEAHMSAWNWLVFARPQRRWAEVWAESAFGRNLEMARKPTVDPDTSVDEIMRRWPMTIRVMIRHRMLCVGCPFGTLHTVADACREHQVPEEDFVQELEAAMAA